MVLSGCVGSEGVLRTKCWCGGIRHSCPTSLCSHKRPVSRDLCVPMRAPDHQVLGLLLSPVRSDKWLFMFFFKLLTSLTWRGICTPYGGQHCYCWSFINKKSNIRLFLLLKEFRYLWVNGKQKLAKLINKSNYTGRGGIGESARVSSENGFCYCLWYWRSSLEPLTFTPSLETFLLRAMVA